MNSKLTPELRRLPPYCVPPQKDGRTSERRVQGVCALGAPARDRIDDVRARRDPPRIMSGPLLILGRRSAVRERSSRRVKKWGRGKKKGDAAQLLLDHKNFTTSQMGFSDAGVMLRPRRAGLTRRASRRFNHLDAAQIWPMSSRFLS